MGLNLRFFNTAGQSSGVAVVPGNLTFSSKLPGGDSQLKFDINGQFVDRFAEYEFPNNTRVELYDSSGGRSGSASPLFSGLLTRPELHDNNNQPTYTGWWATLFDTLYGKPNTGFTSPTYPDDVLKDIVLTAAALISQDVTQVAHNDWDIAAGAASGVKFQRYASAGDVITELIKQPDSTYQQYFAAVWGDKRLYYFARRSSPNWFCRMQDLGQDWQFQLDYTDVWSSLLIEYTDENNARQLSRYFHDAKTQALLTYDKTKYISLNEGDLYTAAAIDGIGVLFMNEHSRPKQRTQSFKIVSGYVMDEGRNPWPSYLVRAGDVIRIVDLPVSKDTWDTDLDNFRTFHLIETSYYTGDGHLTLTPDYPPDTLTTRLLRMATQLQN